MTQESQWFVRFSRLKAIDDCVEKFLEEFNEQVQKLTSDEFKKIVSCHCSDILNFSSSRF